MSNPIWELEGFKENDQNMLNKLVERHTKKKNAEALHQGILTTFVLVAVAFMAWLFLFGVKTSYSGDLLGLVFYYFSNKVNVTGYILLALIYTYWRHQHIKFKKEKDKFEDLRKEVILKSDKYWSNQYDDDALAKIYSELEGKDINVSFKS